VIGIDKVDGEVEGMLEGWRGIEEGGRSLKDVCERLLEERVRWVPYFLTTVYQDSIPQGRLLELTDDMGMRLEHFKELEYATRVLNHPGEFLVVQTDFFNRWYNTFARTFSPSFSYFFPLT
jgi:conserved oligomeric Golgi complex subunit 3